MSSRRGNSLLQKMIQRYFAIPEVQTWLMRREPQQAKNVYTLDTSFSYACMYYAPSRVPRGTERYPLPKPFLDMGDVLLCHNVYDGIAVGTLFNANEEHALSIVRDSMMKGSPQRLSGRPRTRNFAVDLRVKQLEVIEFAWMDDDSLIIACRRLVESRTGERRFVLSADLLFYEPIPRDCGLENRFLILAMMLKERTVICDFCGVQGYQSCTCPNSLKREAPRMTQRESPSDAVVPVRDRRGEPTGPFAGAIGSWENYTRTVFRCSQTGSFFVTSQRRAPNGTMVFTPGPKQPIQYRFVCGHGNDTISLVKLFVQKTMLCQRNIVADTYLYGNGLSRGSHIGMIMDKKDDTSLQRDVFQENEYNTNINSYFQDGNIISTEISTPVTTETVPSQTTLSNDTVVASEYSRLYAPYDVAPPVVTNQSECTDEGNLFITRPTDDSPNSILLDRDEPWQGKWGEPPEPPSDRTRYQMEVGGNEWTDPNQIPQQLTNSQAPPQPRPLPTSSRELQAYMTINASETPTCKVCNTSFPKRGNLARHIQAVHLKLRPFHCDLCPARFGYKAHLKRHRNGHQRSNEFRCPKCNRDFRGQAKLTRHLQQAHRQQPGIADVNATKIQCEVCGVSFSQRSNLSRHMQIHNGVRFFCPVCPNRQSSFGQKYDLQRHVQRKHPGFSEASSQSLVAEKEEPVE